MISVLIASTATGSTLTLLDWIVTSIAGVIFFLVAWYFSYMVSEFGKKPSDSLARKFREEVESRKYDNQIQNRKNKY